MNIIAKWNMRNISVILYVYRRDYHSVRLMKIMFFLFLCPQRAFSEYILPTATTTGSTEGPSGRRYLAIPTSQDTGRDTQAEGYCGTWSLICDHLFLSLKYL